ncbi:heavy metal-associated domain-containing protein, partial [Citrobacter freundii]|uniref:heavy metal-associated domain-containing protein n=1 Tax=Citrobacter freundii TaxID=546 RepID=UPI001952E22F
TTLGIGTPATTIIGAAALGAKTPPPVCDDADLSLFVQPLADGLARLDLAVDGITCAACMPVIEAGLLREPGIAAARVNL